MERPLKIDPLSFAHDFPNDWRVFRESRAQTFFRLYLRRELNRLLMQLETTGPEDLRKNQGQVELTRKFLKLVEQDFIPPETIKEIVEYSER